MTQPLPSPADLRAACTDLARDAAREIMRIYAGDLGVRDKPDKSPVTDADHAAEAIIVAGLRRLTPDTPIVAEEEMAAGRVPVIGDGPFWLVDLGSTNGTFVNDKKVTQPHELVDSDNVKFGQTPVKFKSL